MLLRLVIPLLLLSSCAQIVIPDGGSKDVSPPINISSTPPINSLNSFPSKIELLFNENIALKNPTNPVIINPKLNYIVDVKSQKNRIKLEFPKDSLKPNTTYCLNFGQNIIDINEGNAINNFKYSFSTGPFLDTSILNGIVLSIKENGPIENANVELQNTNNLNTYTTYTDKSGNWALYNIANGRYKLLIYSDINSNKILDLQEPYYSKDITIGDTLLTLKSKLIAFNNFHTSKKLSVLNIKTINEYCFSIQLNTSYLSEDSLARYLNTTLNSNRLYPNKTARNDSFLVYHSWLPTDSLNVTFKTDDTIQHFTLVNPTKSKKSDLTLNLLQPLIVKNKPIYIKTSIPILTIDKTKFKAGVIIKKISSNLFFIDNYDLNNSLLLIEPGTIFDINGTQNNGDTLTLNFATPEQTGNYKFTLKDTLIPYLGPIKVVIFNTNFELTLNTTLNKLNKLSSLLPGKYTLEAWQDENNNGIWDQGNYYLNVNPEKIILKKDFILIKEKWDTNDVEIYMD